MAIKTGGIKACGVVEEGGVISSVFKSCMGNRLGSTWNEIHESSFTPLIGDFIVQGENLSELNGFDVYHVANINGTHTSELCGTEFRMSDAVDAYIAPLDDIYSTKVVEHGNAGNLISCAKKENHAALNIKPTVVIPILDGTLAELDTMLAFSQAGAKIEPFKIRSMTRDDVLESIDELTKLVRGAQIIAIPDGVRNLSHQISILFRDSKLSAEIMKMLYDRDGLMLGIGSGFKALLELGLLPYGKILPEQIQNGPTLTINLTPKHITTIAKIRIATNKTPWLSSHKLSEQFLVPVSHKEGRFVAPKQELEKLIKDGLIATQYVDSIGNATMTTPFNPNGSMYAIEGIISPDGKIFGKTGNSERMGENLYKNIDGQIDMDLFKNGVMYFE